MNNRIKQIFPDDFLWGASTSAFQVEGAAYTNGKGLSVADVRTMKKNDVQMDTTISVDHYHHLEEDVALMSELGLKAYRFSINWTRIFPNGDNSVINEEGVAFYHRLIELLIQNKIEPVVTMFHFDYPMGLISKYDGWVSKEAITDFVNYAAFLLEEYGSKVNYWLTINEQNVMVGQPDILGISEKDPFELYTKAQMANLNMCLAQAQVFKLCREKYPNLNIGPAVSYITALPSSYHSSEVLLAKKLEDLFSFSLMDISIKGKIPATYLNMLEEDGIEINLTQEDLTTLAEGTANFLAVNWYCTTIFKEKANYDPRKPLLENVEIIKNPDLKHTKWGWSFDPIGLRYAMQQLHDRYPDFPVMITECGWSEEENLVDGKVHDHNRIDYLNTHIRQLGLSRYDGVNVIGFYPWSFIDLLSVNDGMEKRYGLVYVDRDNFDKRTLKRYKKDSYHFYNKVIDTNGRIVFEDGQSTQI